MKDPKEIALEHARAMFVYHAAQRHSSIRFYFVALAIVVAGYLGLVTADDPLTARAAWGGVALGIVGIVVSVLFWMLDCRNAKLVGCDEKLLLKIEDEWAISSGITEFRTVHASDNTEPRWLEYKKIMPALFLFFIAISALGLAWSVVMARGG